MIIPFPHSHPFRAKHQFAFFWVCLRRKSTPKVNGCSSVRLFALFKTFELATKWAEYCVFFTVWHTEIYSKNILWVVYPIQSPSNPYYWWFHPHCRSIFPINSQYQNTRCALQLRQQQSWHRYGGWIIIMTTCDCLTYLDHLISIFIDLPKHSLVVLCLYKGTK